MSGSRKQYPSLVILTHADAHGTREPSGTDEGACAGFEPATQSTVILWNGTHPESRGEKTVDHQLNGITADQAYCP